ncbi:hypothetical protein FNU79_03355 [Deinococcus detaillensis]|uniref:Bacteriocin immunity protein n=1 Tax=Deinococcus detaillensis TaxID=2592048 RepID=A0A553V513_9DEIO|nr:hypothetical protein [Deinococcus detaillensis]TSA87532.1 hypothetical protein FNU79_03355 [Deinococcus detaillensis]
MLLIVGKLMTGHPSSDEDDLLDELLELSPDPKISDYIYWPESEISAEEVVDRALSYGPTPLPWSKEN